MATRIMMKSKFCFVYFVPYITMVFVLMFHTNLVSSFLGYFFKELISCFSFGCHGKLNFNEIIFFVLYRLLHIAQ